MPRNVRNFWIELDVDGRKSRIETGPVRKDGGFSLTIRNREQGRISPTTLEVRGYVDGSGQILSLSAGFVSRDNMGTSLRGKEIEANFER